VELRNKQIEEGKAMSFKNKIYLAVIIVLGFIGELIFLGYIATASVQAAEGAAESTFTSPALGLAQSSLNLISLTPVVAGNETVGAVVVYDDPSTPRPADYIELYDNDGDLVAVAWFDRFGIQRMALDRALVEGSEELQGVFVTVVNGESI
jgi:hypothetical protein